MTRRAKIIDLHRERRRRAFIASWAQFAVKWDTLNEYPCIRCLRCHYRTSAIGKRHAVHAVGVAGAL